MNVTVCLKIGSQWRTQDRAYRTESGGGHKMEVGGRSELTKFAMDNEVTVAIGGGRSDAGRNERRLGGVGRRGVLTGGGEMRVATSPARRRGHTRRRETSQ
ncbi:hypothetical protein PIB30_051924 [Stylosanthes scabra]|uniref:Uncharacterized protein n=1 Tax=Stylosanthes scabra TaxID=79078 RepID=A0ABU6SI80_9FABA|nr:hypothetical protein [Stylosanthes scabra]